MLICCSCTRYSESIKEIYIVPKNPTALAVGVSGTLNEFNIMSIDYFMKYSIKDIGAYEYIPEDIREYLEGLDFSPYF